MPFCKCQTLIICINMWFPSKKCKSIANEDSVFTDHLDQFSWVEVWKCLLRCAASTNLFLDPDFGAILASFILT